MALNPIEGPCLVIIMVSINYRTKLLRNYAFKYSILYSELFEKFISIQKIFIFILLYLFIYIKIKTKVLVSNILICSQFMALFYTIRTENRRYIYDHFFFLCGQQIQLLFFTCITYFLRYAGLVLYARKI